MMDSNQFVAASGPVDAVLGVPGDNLNASASMHRYVPMTGSVMDGEDVVQEALIEAYGSWINLTKPALEAVVVWMPQPCIDFCAKGVRDQAELRRVPEAVSRRSLLCLACMQLTSGISLPPKERAWYF